MSWHGPCFLCPDTTVHNKTVFTESNKGDSLYVQSLVILLQYKKGKENIN